MSARAGTIAGSGLLFAALLQGVHLPELAAFVAATAGPPVDTARMVVQGVIGLEVIAAGVLLTRSRIQPYWALRCIGGMAVIVVLFLAAAGARYLGGDCGCTVPPPVATLLVTGGVQLSIAFLLLGIPASRAGTDGDRGRDRQRSRGSRRGSGGARNPSGPKRTRP